MTSSWSPRRTHWLHLKKGTTTRQAISLKLDSNHWFFGPYAHEIWWSRKTIGHLFCATSSFVHDFKAIGDFNLELLSGNTQFGSKLAIFACVTLKFDGKQWKTIGHLFYTTLTHWGRVTQICVVKLTIFASDNGLSPERRQAIIWTNAGILLIGPLGTNFSEILIEIQTFSLKKTRLKMSSDKCCSFRPGLNELKLDDMSNMLNMQHIIPNLKRWDYSGIPGGGHK